FIKKYATQLKLHSFPTRRSSDLRGSYTMRLAGLIPIQGVVICRSIAEIFLRLRGKQSPLEQQHSLWADEYSVPMIVFASRFAAYAAAAMIIFTALRKFPVRKLLRSATSMRA